MEIYMEIMEVIWLWYIPGVLSWLAIICMFNYGVTPNFRVKIFHLICSLIMGILGLINFLLAITIVMPITIEGWWSKFKKDVVPKKWMNFLNQEL